MATDSLEDFLSVCGVEPSLCSHLVAAGWTTESFSTVVSSLEGFDSIWDELITSSSPPSLLQKACIKAAWKRLQTIPEPAPAAASSDSTPDASWTETAAPKLNASVVASLKQAFLKNYPSEVLTPDAFPSSRLLALAHQQVQKKEFRWIPWKFRLSQSKMEDIQMQRPQKTAKLDVGSLHGLLLDDPPSLEVSNHSMGLHGIRTMFDLVNAAYALVNGAHLARLRAYSTRFLQLTSSRLDPESGLRHVNVLEAQAADRQLWNIMFDLAVDKDWSLNDSLHEVTHLRSDMLGLLQPRPKMPKISSGPQQILSYEPSKGKGKGKKGKKGKPSSSGPRWVSEIHAQGQRHSICMRFQTGQCAMSNCRFKHVCAYPKADGSACGGSHSAKDHETTPHLTAELPVSPSLPVHVGSSDQPLNSLPSACGVTPSVVPR